LSAGRRLSARRASAPISLFWVVSWSPESTITTLRVRTLGPTSRPSWFANLGHHPRFKRVAVKHIVKAQYECTYAMGTKRAHVLLPDDLLREIDALVGPRRAQRFLGRNRPQPSAAAETAAVPGEQGLRLERERPSRSGGRGVRVGAQTAGRE
jgi:hypothetical protein